MALIGEHKTVSDTASTLLGLWVFVKIRENGLEKYENFFQLYKTLTIFQGNAVLDGSGIVGRMSVLGVGWCNGAAESNLVCLHARRVVLVRHAGFKISVERLG